ncbi:MAG: GTP-binding protein [Atopobiaceae bacterium]|nr:GTP-binding protein [Atopobiaceae bacterium]
MRQAVVGLLAHVDAGKTTLAEATLAAAGAIRNLGRVDSGSSHLDTDAMERDHLGPLTGALLTDVRITLLAGRAHPKHTEGGDFRQATYRAVRQALMGARERRECLLLEPWYRFRLTVPADRVGRALTDLTRMAAEFDASATSGDAATVAGEVPASEVGEYALEVARYTGGRGRLSLELAGYRPCHNADAVIAAAAYDPEADLPNTPDSVFCSHGAGHTVKWRDVPAHAHTVVDPARLRTYRAADATFFSAARS